MKNSASISTHDQYAEDYDRLVDEYGSHAAEILFGLCFEYIRPGERLLDTGIGTGLSSQDFTKAGLEIYGVDGSAPMLEVCRAKGLAQDLKQWDLTMIPWPYGDHTFNHVLACGLFHFFSDLTRQFTEASRLLSKGGLFSFTVMSRSGVDGLEAAQGSYAEMTRGDAGVTVHSAGYIEALLESQSFQTLKRARFLLWSGEAGLDDEFTAFVCQKQSPR